MTDELSQLNSTITKLTEALEHTNKLLEVHLGIIVPRRGIVVTDSYFSYYTIPEKKRSHDACR
jgi:hypothetical protein